MPAAGLGEHPAVVPFTAQLLLCGHSGTAPASGCFRQHKIKASHQHGSCLHKYLYGHTGIHNQPAARHQTPRLRVTALRCCQSAGESGGERNTEVQQEAVCKDPGFCPLSVSPDFIPILKTGGDIYLGSNKRFDFAKIERFCLCLSTKMISISKVGCDFEVKIQLSHPQRLKRDVSTFFFFFPRGHFCLKSRYSYNKLYT